MAEESPNAPLTPLESRLSYFGVGCVGAIVGLVGGGMIAVLIAKIVGGLMRCPAVSESGAPCSWTDYWTWGARIGVILVPTVSILLLRRGRRRSQNSD
jgi:F0F1-type ATP synthase membrane subunit c/vacuolar-type H+-ATPase subunit K